MITHGTRKQAQAMSNAWRHPQFKDVDGFVNAISVTEDAEFVPIEIRGKTLEDRVAVCGKESGEAYGISSKRYKIVQNQEVLLPLAMAIQEADLDMCGSILSDEGVTRAALTIGEPITLADSDYRMTITAYNSYNGELAFGGVSGLLRLLCSNGMMDIQGITCNVRQKHIVDFNDSVSKWLRFFEDSADMAVKIEPLVKKCIDNQIEFPQLEAIYRGAGVGQRTAIELVENFDKLVPDNSRLGINQWTAGNALTAYYSHRKKGNYKTNAEGLSLAGRFFNIDVSGAYQIGNKMLTDEADEKRAKQALKTFLA